MLPCPMDEMCPGCVFAYPKAPNGYMTTWNTENQTPTVLTSSDYEENYEDVITSSGKNFFLGLKLNGSNQIEEAYVCGLYNDETPFCIEGSTDGSTYTTTSTFLNDSTTGIWQGRCDVDEFSVACHGSVEAYAYPNGYVSVNDAVDSCIVFDYGYTHC